MKNIVVATAFSMTFGLAALAQTTPTNTQPQISTSQASHILSSDMSSSGIQSMGEKRLRGCVKSKGGNYVLQEKGKKDVALGGSQNFATHLGHTVTLRGTFANGSHMDNGGSANASTDGTPVTFIVSKLDMVSESCGLDPTKTATAAPDSRGKPSPYRTH
jgi:hypothetical protein